MPPLPAPIWALGFANPALLYGLAAASVPILIHLLNRRRFRETRWAAMKFLMAAIRKNQRRVRIEQWLLLALRTLIVLLVVAAMARPFLESFGLVIAGQRTHRVLVLDGSLSMGYTSGGTSRFDQAKVLAAQLVRDSRPGDAISMVVMGRPPRIVIGAPSINHAEVRKEVEELTQTHGGVDLVATFEAVERVLESSTTPQKEVLFVTDLQATSWKLPEGEQAGAFQRLVAKLEARRPRSVIIDLGRTGSENRAVTDLRLQSPVVTAGATTLVRATARNFGPAPASGVRARLTVDGRLGPEQSVDLPPGEDVPLAFNHQFVAPGDHLLEVTLDGDALPLDDVRRMVVPVRESIPVLLVDGSYKAEPFQAETDYLAQALAPSEAVPGQTNAIRAEVISEAQLARTDLSAYDAVFLCNVAQFSPPEVAALEDFLKQGGGVVFFGGDQVLRDNYNRLLFAGGKGILPAEVGPSVGDASAKQAAFGFDPLGYRHPLTAEFARQSDPVTSGLTRALSWQYHKLSVPPSTPARVALAFDNGDPAVVEAPRHRGTVLQVATSADAGWTTWPLHNGYLPVMQQLAFVAAAGKTAERNIAVGQPYDATFPGTAAAAPVDVQVPGGPSLASRLKPAGGVSQLHFEETALAGRYAVKIGPPLGQETSFAANPDPAESDLTKLDPAALAERIPGWNVAVLANWRELSRGAASVGRRGELHRPLLIAVLGLLLAETVLAWKFGHHDPSS